MRMSCSPARFSKFQTEFYSGCSPHMNSTRVVALFSKTLGCSPCFPEALRFVREWVVAHSGYQNRVLTRVVFEFYSDRCPFFKNSGYVAHVFLNFFVLSENGS